MTNWQAGETLTNDIVASTRYMLVIADGDLFAFDEDTCVNGLWTLRHIDGAWVISDIYDDAIYPVQWYMAIDAPPEG